ncbi:DUF3999 domain-containing protein [Novilysobacter erysipheiresistens]|uniref:DUF3999 domain-containing protein n=1 Tax=Novilysobacter erysipheiresistens TaxID=1749332 RepID=A0ABU7Z176_9GAMM
MRQVLIGLLALPLLAMAAPQADYATQWPLRLESEDAGAYQVQLDASVYRQLQAADLGDLAVLNGEGAVLPVARLPVPAQPVQRASVPLFALPVPGRGAAEWQLITRADADGRLRQVEVRSEDGTPMPAADGAWLLDLGGIDASVVALELGWAPVTGMDLGYRLEASDNLEHWRPLPAHGRLIDLQRDGHRLLQRRIDLPGGTDAHYLRLLPEGRGGPVTLTGVDAVLALGPVPAPQWLELSPVDTEPAQRVFEYRLDGRFPVGQVDVAMPGNHAAEWRLESRDDADAPWRLRAGPWIAYRVGTAGGASRSAARVLDTAIRDRHWRLRSDAGVAGTPTLRLGYRPETVVFLARGPAPYRLVAGSARVQQQASPLPQLLAALRDQHGPDWQPARAELGESKTLAGAAALTPTRDWKTWMLWGVLGLGVLLVASLAVAVLRNPRNSST